MVLGEPARAMKRARFHSFGIVGFGPQPGGWSRGRQKSYIFLFMCVVFITSYLFAVLL